MSIELRALRATFCQSVFGEHMSLPLPRGCQHIETGIGIGGGGVACRHDHWLYAIMTRSRHRYAAGRPRRHIRNVVMNTAGTHHHDVATVSRNSGEWSRYRTAVEWRPSTSCYDIDTTLVGLILAVTSEGCCIVITFADGLPYTSRRRH